MTPGRWAFAWKRTAKDWRWHAKAETRRSIQASDVLDTTAQALAELRGAVRTYLRASEAYGQAHVVVLFDGGAQAMRYQDDAWKAMDAAEARLRALCQEKSDPIKTEGEQQ